MRPSGRGTQQLLLLPPLLLPPLLLAPQMRP
jgi:hypothetical protein